MKKHIHALALGLAAICLFACSNGEQPASGDASASSAQPTPSTPSTPADTGTGGQHESGLTMESSEKELTPAEKVQQYLVQNEDARGYTSEDRYDPEVKLEMLFDVVLDTFYVDSRNTGSRYETHLSWTFGNEKSLTGRGVIDVAGTGYDVHFKLEVAGDSVRSLGIEEEIDGEIRTERRVQTCFDQLVESLAKARELVLTPCGVTGW